jgi:clan AA aspartic protease
MICGTVSAERDARIELVIRSSDDGDQRIKPIIDTGFNGWLSLSPELIAALGLTWRRRGRGQLADGSERVFDIYVAEIAWDGRSIRVPVDAVEAAPMIGMALLEGHELTIQVRAGGEVRIAPLE